MLSAELSATLEHVADALDACDSGEAEDALEQARSLDGYVEQFEQTPEMAEESARLVPCIAACGASSVAGRPFTTLRTS